MESFGRIGSQDRPYGSIFRRGSLFGISGVLRLQKPFVMRLEPAANGQHLQKEQLVHLNAALDGKVATLAKSRQVPVLAVGLVSVEMMNG